MEEIESFPMDAGDEGEFSEVAADEFHMSLPYQSDGGLRTQVRNFEKEEQEEREAELHEIRSAVSKVSQRAGESDSRRISLSAMSSSNSRAVLSALKSLQEKIRRLETERDYYKESFELSKKHAFDFREEIENNLEKLRREKANTEDELRSEIKGVIEERNELASALNIVKEQMTGLEKELKYIREVSHDQESEKTVYRREADGLRDQLTALRQEAVTEIGDRQRKIEGLDSKSRELETSVVDLEGILQEEKEYRMELESQKSRLESALKEVLKLNKSLVEKVSEMERSGGSRKRDRPGSKQKRKKNSLPISMPPTFHEKVKREIGGEVPFIVSKTLGPSFNVTAAVQQAAKVTNPKRVSKKKQSKKSKREKADIADAQEELSDAPVVDTLDLSSKVSQELVDSDFDVDQVIHSLEYEYEKLNQEYKDLLAKTQDCTTLTNEEFELTRSLKGVIDNMERKGRQLRQLKSYRRIMTTSLREAMSPPKVPGAEKRSKALRLFHSLRKSGAES